VTTIDGPAVVIGLGNVLLGDDGVGVRVVEAMLAAAGTDPAATRPATRLVDGGTLGLGLLRFMDGARSLLLVDAVDLSRPPGTVCVLRGDEIDLAAGRWGSSISGGVGELLAAARLLDRLSAPVSLIGIQVDEVHPGTALSPRVEAAVPVAAQAVRRELLDLDLGGSAKGAMA
jgi:hydrogenase maturation protease